MFLALIVVTACMAVMAVIGAAFTLFTSRALDRAKRPGLAGSQEPFWTPFDDSAAAAVLSEDADASEPRRVTTLAKPGIETYFENGEWKNKVQGSSRAANKHSSKAAAVKAGREMARKRRVEHTIKNKYGTVSEKKSYGNDPRKPPG